MPGPTRTWIPPRAERVARPVSSAEERLDSVGGESGAVFLLNLLAEVGGCGVEVLVMQYRLDRVKEPPTT